jgi:hypothetical protein
LTDEPCSVRLACRRCFHYEVAFGIHEAAVKSRGAAKMERAGLCTRKHVLRTDYAIYWKLGERRPT